MFSLDGIGNQRLMAPLLNTFLTPAAEAVVDVVPLP